MDKTDRLISIVSQVLTDHEDARNDLFVLYYWTCKSVNPRMVNAKFGTVLQSHSEYNVPKFESVARARRDIVHDNPELKGCDEVEGGRWSSEMEYRERYARR